MKLTNECCCGGSFMISPHESGVQGCLREPVAEKDNPLLLDNGHWLVEGHEITPTTLFEQRLYSENNGRWTRSKDHRSTNSLPDET